MNVGLVFFCHCVHTEEEIKLGWEVLQGQTHESLKNTVVDIFHWLDLLA